MRASTKAGAAVAGRFLRHPADGLLGDPEPNLVAGGELGPEPGRTGCTQGLRLCATPEGTCASISSGASGGAPVAQDTKSTSSGSSRPALWKG